jgi:hypothetical protein
MNNIDVNKLLIAVASVLFVVLLVMGGLALNRRQTQSATGPVRENTPSDTSGATISDISDQESLTLSDLETATPLPADATIMVSEQGILPPDFVIANGQSVVWKNETGEELVLATSDGLLADIRVPVGGEHRLLPRTKGSYIEYYASYGSMRHRGTIRVE